MIELFKTVKIITENIPSHFWDTYNNLPMEVRLVWLKRINHSRFLSISFF